MGVFDKGINISNKGFEDFSNILRKLIGWGSNGIDN